jgi:glycosyltransferase involved in cell wall biosynthesis
VSSASWEEGIIAVFPATCASNRMETASRSVNSSGAEFDITVAVPIYNEEDNIPLLYERTRDALDALGRSWELILVNDGSKDGSAVRLDALAAADSRVVVIHLSRNYGQTAAFMAGLDHARGEIIVPMDGDLQNDPADIGRLLAKLDEGYDVVSGWRKDRQDHAIKRNLPSRIANSMISRVSGVHLHDYGCSLKAYRREVLDGVKLYGEMHRFVPIYAAWNGARVGEMAVTHHPRIHGESKYGLERIVKVVLDLLVVKFLFKYAGKPIYVFGGFGLFSILLSFRFGAWALGLKFFSGTSLIQTPLPLLAVFLFMIGIMSILMGLLAEMINRTYHESQSKAVYRVARIVNRTMVGEG